MRPGYKQTEVGVIPKDWEVSRIVDLASITTGSRNTQDKDDDGEFPFFVRSQTVERINSFSYDGEAVLTAGDGVGTGKIFHYVNGRFDVHQRVYQICEFTPLLDGRFFYLVFSTRFFDRIMSMTAKSSVDSVRRDMIANMVIPLAPPDEQRAIAAALGDVDAAVAGLERLIAKKRDLKRAAMQQLLTGQTRLPGFSGEWEVKRLGDHVTFLRNGTLSRAQLTTSDTTRYLHYGDIHGSEGVFLCPNVLDMPSVPATLVSRLERLEHGDLIFADASEDLDGVGKSVEVALPGAGPEVVSGLHTIAARFDKEVLADGFKAYLQFMPTFASHLKKHAAGTKVLATNRGHVASAEVPLPKPDEQGAISAVFRDMDAELAALQAQLDKTRLIKQAMMQDLLTGRVRLPFQ